MKLQTNIAIRPGDHPLSYESRLLLLGSCFAQNIGDKLSYYQFRCVQNPMGILFHPMPLTSVIRRAVEARPYTAEDIFCHNERWHCFETHSSLSAGSRDQLLQNLTTALSCLRNELLSASHVLITLGTAWGYREVNGNKLVGNCHKLPQKEFRRELTPVETLLNTITEMQDLVVSLNPQAKVIFTISPVRHLREGFIENQQSKAHLITALHQIMTTSGSQKSIFYFPAYELLMDELRDYRFYAADMVHPNALAIDYIWEKFSEAWISKQTQLVMDSVADIQKGIAHRPFDPSSLQHREFRQQLKNKITVLQKKYPHMAFTI